MLYEQFTILHAPCDFRNYRFVHVIGSVVCILFGNGPLAFKVDSSLNVCVPVTVIPFCMERHCFKVPVTAYLVKSILVFCAVILHHSYRGNYNPNVSTMKKSIAPE